MRLALVSIALGLCFLIPDGAVAQGLVSSCEGANCSACDVISLANNIIQWLIGIAFLFFAILSVYHGFKLVTSGGNSGAKSAAKSGFTSAFIGLFIMLGAFLIVDTIMRGVVRGSDGNIEGYGPWAEIQCLEQNAAGFSEIDVNEPEFQVFLANGGEEVGVASSGNNCPAAQVENMVVVPSGLSTRNGIKVSPTTLKNFTAMQAAAQKDGIYLRITSGWRSEAMQVALWNNRAKIGAVAQPCTLGGNGSNHNSGIAIDITVGDCKNKTTNCRSKEYLWLKANGGTYGFYNNLPSDPVHWSPSGK